MNEEDPERDRATPEEEFIRIHGHCRGTQGARVLSEERAGSVTGHPTDGALQDSKEERGEPQRGPSVTNRRHRHTEARLTSSRHPPSHDAVRAADCKDHSKHILTLTSEHLPVGCI